MIRRVFPVMLPHATDDACMGALRACTSGDGLFVETNGALPRVGEELTVSCRRAGGPEIVRVDGRATWAVHEGIGRYRRGFALSVTDESRGVLAALDGPVANEAPLLRADGTRDPFAVGSATTATVRPGAAWPPPVLDDVALQAWRARRAERMRKVEETVELAPELRGPGFDEREAPAKAASSDDTGSVAAAAEDTVSMGGVDRTQVTMPAIVVDAFAEASAEAALADQEPTLSTPHRDDEIVVTDGPSGPRKNPWSSNPSGDPQELPRLVDDEEEDATLLIGPRTRPLPSLAAFEPLPFPTLVGVAYVVEADRPKQSPTSTEKLSWPRTGTKRGMSPFADNDDTIPVGLWTMPSLLHASITSDEETPDELSDPRLIVRAADRARALDTLSDVPDLADLRRRGEQKTALPHSLHQLVDDVEDESTDAALDDSTADASADEPPAASVSTDTAKTARQPPLPTPQTDIPRLAESAVVDEDTAGDTKAAAATETGTLSPSETRRPVDEATPASGSSPVGVAAVKAAATAANGVATRSAILVSWGAEVPRVLFGSDAALPVHAVLDVPRRHLRFAEIAVFEGAPESEHTKGLLGIVRLQVAPETNSRTLPVRFSLTSDGVVAVTYDGRVVERLRTSWAARPPTLVVEAPAPTTIVGRLKRLFQGQ
jgi:hypothetical protein